ncbi:MAG: recombinase family protein [Blautia sp.]|nr:recombinase family protein [Blautia sp.]
MPYLPYLAKYLRISEDDEDMGAGKQESDSIANQRKVLDAYIAAHGEFAGCPVKEFVDDGVSGVNFQRPAVQELLNEVRAGSVSCILVKDLSRFGRNYIEVGDYIEQIFPFLGVRFISVTDRFDSSERPAGLEVGFKNLVHDLYSRDLSVKIKSSIKMRQKRGGYNGGGVPFGYKLGDKGDKDAPLIPDPEAAGIVRRIFGLAADGHTTSGIADILNKEAVPTPGAYKRDRAGIPYRFINEKRNLWKAAQVNLILRNDVYRGTYVAHKESTVRPGVVKRNQSCEYITIENHHEGLVGEELFRKAQGVLKPGGKMARKTEYDSALKGRVKCGNCGYSMSVRREAKEPYYRCCSGKGCGAYTKINVELLEATVWGILQKLMETYCEQETARENERAQMLASISEAKERKRMWEGKIEHCRTSRLELYHQWKEGEIAKEEYIRKKEQFHAQEAECQKELEQVGQCLEEMLVCQEIPGQKEGLARLAGAGSLTKELADLLIERVEVYDGDRVEIKWKIDEIKVE